jgi:hypothetical protein
MSRRYQLEFVKDSASVSYEKRCGLVKKSKLELLIKTEP